MRTFCAALVFLFMCAQPIGGYAQDSKPAGDETEALVSRALQLQASGECDAALPLAQKAADLLRARGNGQSADFAFTLVVQGLCYRRLTRVVEAERVYRQAIELYESVQGPNDRGLAIALDNLASLYLDQDRLAEAEQLRVRAVQIFRLTLDPGSPNVAVALQNLGVLYQRQKQFSKAQDAFLGALDAGEKAVGPDSNYVATIADNLAGVYREQGRFDLAEAMYLRAISVFEKVAGGDHPDTAIALQNYAILLSYMRKSHAAEANLRRALAINERLYGANHVTILAALNTLALDFIAREQWRDALETSRRAAAVAVPLAGRGKISLPTEGGQSASTFRRLVRAAYSLDAANRGLMDESYLAAQRALDTNASRALAQMAVRHAAGSDPLAILVREREDLIQELGACDSLLIASVAKAPGQRDRNGEAALKAQVEKIAGRIDAIGAELSRQFPEYATLSRPTPLSIAATQALLKPNEVLLQYLDLQALSDTPETGFAWLVTKTDAEWVRLPIGTQALAQSVAALRCGLDSTQWSGSKAKRCSELLKVDAPEGGAPLPFDLAIAHELYRTLLGRFEAKIKGKHLLVVPSGALATVPLSILVTEKPDRAVPSTIEGYRNAKWLGLRQPITILPSVASLKGLRTFAKRGRATKPYLGVGNPLLDGPQTDPQYGAYYREQAQAARTKQECRSTAIHSAAATVTRRGGGFGGPLRSVSTDIDTIRKAPPLPETADELCEIARRLGVPASEILLGGRATEQALRGLSEQGRLAEYGVLHFATHGALAGEVKGSAEPGLVLTPPAQGTGGANELERDDGFLTASEISTLKLDADWVVLSACNTAGSSRGTTEALSGLARAFFYAGARALLVSHWAVDSDAAVLLTTRAFEVLRSRPATGRAEALRIAMRDLAGRGDGEVWHPSQWAPFTVVGEGAAPIRAASVATRLRAPKPAAAGTERSVQRSKSPRAPK